MRHDAVGGACLETTAGGNPSNPHAWSTSQPHPFAARSIPVCTRERRHHLGATAEIEPGGPLKFVHDLEGMPRRFARLSIAQRYSAGPLAYSPTVPSIASRRKSAWPAWRAVSPIRCSSTQRREKRVPSRSGWTDRWSRRSRRIRRVGSGRALSGTAAGGPQAAGRRQCGTPSRGRCPSPRRSMTPGRDVRGTAPPSRSPRPVPGGRARRGRELLGKLLAAEPVGPEQHGLPLVSRY